MKFDATSVWSFHNPVQLHGGDGLIGRLPEFLPSQGRLLFVTSQGFIQRGLTARVSSAVGGERICLCADITPNPDIEELGSLITKLRGDSFAAILALGGGSVLDAAKVFSVLLPTPPAVDLAVVLKNNEQLAQRQAIPVFAIPTTSGTGAEVTPFATIWDRKLRKKHSLASPKMFPVAALLDPSITLTLPSNETLYTGLDAISHCLESLWNRNRSPLSETCASRGLDLALEALPEVIRDPFDLGARARMQLAALLAGLAISQTRTAIAHSISYPLTLQFGVPHGLACSFTLPSIIEFYLQRCPASPYAPIMRKARTCLLHFGLGDRLCRYVNQDQVNSLESEMFTPGRADNFEVPPVHVRNFLRL